MSDESVDVKTIPDDGPVTLTTDKGKKIEADIVFKTVGLPVQKDAYSSTLGRPITKLIKDSP